MSDSTARPAGGPMGAFGLHVEAELEVIKGGAAVVAPETENEGDN